MQVGLKEDRLWRRFNVGSAWAEYSEDSAKVGRILAWNGTMGANPPGLPMISSLLPEYRAIGSLRNIVLVGTGGQARALATAGLDSAPVIWPNGR